MDYLACLKSFYQIANHQSFTKAAKYLDISISVISKRIKFLENHYKSPLFYRSSQRISLTPKGQILQQHVKELLQLSSKLDDMMKLENEISGNIILNAPIAFGIHYLPKLLTAYHQKYPNINFQIDLDDYFYAFTQQNFDLLIRISKGLPDTSLHATKLGTINRVLCAAPEYINLYGQPITLKDLAKHSCLLYRLHNKDTAWLFLENNTWIQPNLNKIIIANNGNLLKELAVLGAGLVLLPEFLVEKEIKKKQLIVLLPNYKIESRNVYVLHHLMKSTLPKKHQLLIEYLQNYLNYSNLSQEL